MVPSGPLPEGDTAGVLNDLFASRAFLDSFTQGMVIHDLEGRIVDANAAASKLLGVTRDQLMGRTAFDHVWHAVKEDGTDYPGEEHPAMIALRTQQPCHGVIMGIDQPGQSRRWLRINANPLWVDNQFVAVSVVFADVTAPIELQRELRSTTEHLRILAQHPADVVVLATKDAVGEWASDSITELLGWSPQEVVGRRIDSFVHPEDLGSIVDFRRLAPDAPSAQFLVRLRRKDGDFRWVSISARRFTDTVENVSRIVSSWRDAQDLVETTSQLKEAQERFQFLAENASDIVGETDADFNFTWMSPSVYDILGWRPEDMIHQPVTDYVFLDDRPAFHYERANLGTGMRPQVIKARFLTSSGSTRWMVARSRPKLSDCGTPVSYMVSLHDVHDEEMIRHELQASEERYRLLADHSSDLILLLAADNSYRWVSPSATELFDWTPQEMVGKCATDFVHPDDLAHVIDQRENHLRDSFSIDALRWRKSTGDYAWVSGRGRDIRNSMGEVEGRIIALRDISAQVASEHKLAQSEALFRLVLENQVDVTAQLSLGGTIEWITPSALDLVGWRADEIVGKNIGEFVSAQDVPGLTLVVGNVTAGNPDRFEARVHTITGDDKWVAASAKPLFDQFGETIGSVINVRDIGAQHEALTNLARSEEQFRLAMESAPIGMALVGLDRRFQAVNPAMCVMVGRTRQWLLDHAISDIIDDDDDELDLRMRAEALSGRIIHSAREKRFHKADGTLVWVEHAIGLVRDESSMPVSFVSTFVDVTEKRARQEKLHYQATHDALTHLVNRRDLYQRAEDLRHRAVRTGDLVGVLYVDIDGFKMVNDTFGHYVGDIALITAATRLAAVGRNGDVVSRVGGDEFVILLPALHSVDDAQLVAQKIQRSFSEPVIAEGESISLGVSIGVALAQAGEDPVDTVRRADTALHHAKLRGRGQSVSWLPEFDAPQNEN
jgi:diguanylate cyclase (GGDEF)-like protein/PAS domain S-box-containing protein